MYYSNAANKGDKSSRGNDNELMVFRSSDLPNLMWYQTWIFITICTNYVNLLESYKYTFNNLVINV